MLLKPIRIPILALLFTLVLAVSSSTTPTAAIGGSPALTSPRDGTIISSFSATLRWTNPPGASQYHLQVIPFNNDGPGVDLHIGSPGTSFNIPAPPSWYGLLPDMTYRWRLRVSDAPTYASLEDSSWGPWTERSFKTPKVSSSTIIPVNPPAGDVIGMLAPTIQWANSRSDVFYYEIQISKDRGFNTDPATAIAPVYWELRHAGATSPPSSYDVPSDLPLENFATYYWRVRPRIQGDGTPVAWSGAFSFSTGIFPPEGLSHRVVLGQYYAWFDAENFSAGITSDTPLSPYNSEDTVAISRHVAEARRAGLDALALSWLGPGDRTDSNLLNLLSAGQTGGLWVTVTFETDKQQFADQEQVVSGLLYARDHYAARPNWLRYQGRPVFLFWRPGGVALKSGQTVLSAWQEIRDRVDPHRQAIWIMEGLDWDLLEVFDGQFGYSIAWSSDPHYTLSSWASQVRSKAAQLGRHKLFVGTVMPGYNDTLVRPAPEGFAKDREGGDYFARTWDAAIGSSADWVNLTSFNEWIEGSQIEPSVSYGDHYLNINKEWSDRYKGLVP